MPRGQPRVVSAATNHFWHCDATAQIVADPGAAPVMHPQRLYVRNEAVVLGDPAHSDVDPCRSYTALNFLKKKHMVNLATATKDRASQVVPPWVAATPGVEAYMRRGANLKSPRIPSNLLSETERRHLLAEAARRRRGGAEPTREYAAFAPPVQRPQSPRDDRDPWGADRERYDQYDELQPHDYMVGEATRFDTPTTASDDEETYHHHDRDHHHHHRRHGGGGGVEPCSTADAGW